MGSLDTGKTILFLGCLYFFICSLDLLSKSFRLIGETSDDKGYIQKQDVHRSPFSLNNENVLPKFGINTFTMQNYRKSFWTFTFGTATSIGLYNIDFEDHFNTGSAEVSLIEAINTGVFFGAGPLAGILISKWSHRKIAFIGAICSCAGLIAMSFAPNLAYSYFFYGILNGFGNSLAVTSSQVLCGQHYVRNRGITSSFVLSGTGIGSAMFPIILNNLIQIYGWRGSLLLLSGINLHLLLFALVLFPPKSFPRQSTVQTDHFDGDMNARTSKENSAIENSDHHNGDKKERQKQGLGTNTFKTYMAIYLQTMKSHIKKIQNLKFLIFLISTLLFNIGYMAFVIFLPQLSINVGFDEDDASFELTLVGCGLFVGCIVGSLLGNLKFKLIVLITGSIGFGCVVILMDVFKQREIFMSLSFMSGVSSGFETAYLLAIACEILGDEDMAIGFGCVMFAVGLGCMVGPPIAGTLVDHYHDTSYVLYLAGSVAVLSGLIMCPYLILPKVKKCYTKTTMPHSVSSTITLVSVISK